MSGILGKIKLFLYNNEILSLNSFERKIEYLLLSNLNLYDKEYIFKSTLLLEKDIISYIEEIERLIKYDLEKDYVTVKDINADSYVIKDLGVWCSDNGNVIDSFNYINKFLNLSLILYNKFNIICNNNIEPVLFYNSSKIKPYIINIDLIVNKLVDITLNKGF